MLKVTIIGCGHGGQALAADLSKRGCSTSLYAHPNHQGGIAALSKQGGIHTKGLINGFIPLDKITTHLPEAIEQSDYIFIVLPSYAHEMMFMELVPCIKPGQTIITLAANFASLTYLKLLEQAEKNKGIDLIDIASLPYVCRADNRGTVEIVSVKKKLAAASIPANAIEKHLRKLAPIFPSPLTMYPDVLSLGLNITSGITHPAIALLNAGRIGKDKDIFYFYRDGITPEIAVLIEQLDAERMAIGKRLGLEMQPYLDLMADYYGTRYESVYQFFRESPVHNALPLCPTSLKERYITQDVAGLLVSWHGLAKLAKIETIALTSLINIASLLNNTHYLRTGTNLARLNLHDKTLSEIKHYVRSGTLPLYLNELKSANFLEYVA